MRSCTVRGILDGEMSLDADEDEEFVRIEKYLCAVCRPAGWVMLTANAGNHVASASLSARALRKFCLAGIKMADELEAQI